MGVFIRQNAIAGDSVYRTLQCGADVTTATAGDNIIRLSQSDVTDIAGLYSTAFTTKTPMGAMGRRTIASRTSNVRQIVFTFACGDTQGYEEALIRNFFTYDRAITYVDSERKVPQMKIYTTSIDDSSFSDGSVLIKIGAMAEYDLPTQERSVVLTTSSTSGSLSITNDFTNELAAPCSIQLQIVATKGGAWNNAKFILNSSPVTFSAEATGQVEYQLGTLGVSGSYSSSSITMDSVAEFVVGDGIILPSGTKRFFTIPAGVHSTITAKSDGSPYPRSESVTYNLIAYYSAPRGMYSSDFS